jgi:hypothetical protein
MNHVSFLQVIRIRRAEQSETAPWAQVGAQSREGRLARIVGFLASLGMTDALL